MFLLSYTVQFDAGVFSLILLWYLGVCFRLHSKRQQAQSINISKHPSKPTSINLNTTIHTLI